MIALVILFLLILLAFSYWRLYLAKGKKSLFLLRVIAFSLLLFLLLEPYITLEGKIRRPLVFLLDSSKSMSVEDAELTKSRWEIQLALWQELSTSLENKFKIQTYHFSSQLQPLGKEEGLIPQGERTLIGENIRRVVDRQKIPPTAIILLSDGQDNAAQEPLSYLSGREDIPIHSVGIGSGSKMQDLSITQVEGPKEIAPEEKAELWITLHSKGFAQKEVELNLSLGDQVLESKKTILEQAKPYPRLKMQFSKGKSGIYPLKFHLPPLEEERIRDNNSRFFTIRVTGRKCKVMYIEGGLGWEYKFIKKTLDKFPQMQSSSSVMIKPGEFRGEVKKEPFAELSSYQVLILGNLPSTYLEDEQMHKIADFVRAGGGLILLGGENSFSGGAYQNSPLEKVLPVLLSGGKDTWEKASFKPALTLEGKKHPIFAGWSKYFPQGNLPTLQGYSQVLRKKAGAVVLLEDPTHKNSYGPYIIMAAQRYAEGKTIAITTHSLWKWGFSLKKTGGFFAALWYQLIDYVLPEKSKLIKGKSIGVMTDKDYYEKGEEVKIKALLWEDELPANFRIRGKVHLPEPPLPDAEELSGSSGKTSKKVAVKFEVPEATPREWSSSFYPSEEGEHKIKVHLEGNDKTFAAETFFTVGNPFLEWEYISLNESILKEIADFSGGKYYDMIEASRLPEDIQAREEVRRFSYRGGKGGELPFFVCFILFLSLEWILRRRLAVP